MKKMIYDMKIKRELLYSGNYKCYNFYIMNLGLHPTAYIELPKEHKYSNINDYDDIDLQVHGGITYIEKKFTYIRTRKIKN